MRRFEYMLWLLVAVFCLMPCGVSAAETQKDLKIQEVFQRYGKKRNVTMVELSNEMLETYGMTRYKSITIKDDPEPPPMSGSGPERGPEDQRGDGRWRGSLRLLPVEGRRSRYQPFCPF